jgi:UDP-N-acetyl-D-mannosaminuronic acid dehydrogenase
MIQSVPEAFKDRSICVLGLGYVGLTLAVAMADSGFEVYGVELRDEVLDGLERLEPHFFEPRLKEKLIRVRGRGHFSFGKTLPKNLRASVFMITVGTPLGADGKARLDSVETVARQVALHAPDNSLVILRSTVKLGTARKVVKPILEASGKNFSIAVCPERTLEGKALTELHELPQIIGADDADTRMRCMQIFNLMTRTTVAVRNLETAELIKLVDNTYRDVMFAFANEIAELSANANVSAAEVVRAGRLGYARNNVAWPGPVGGPCLAKDPHILAESASQFGVTMGITKASRAVNEAAPSRAANHMANWIKRIGGFPAAPRISLLGLAFKGVPATDDLRGTMALPIHEALSKAFPTAQFRGYDPLVRHAVTREAFGIDVAADLQDAFKAADLVVVMNNHPQFQTMDVANLAQFMNRPGLVYDFWNMYEDIEDHMPEGRVYMAFGSERARGWN